MVCRRDICSCRLAEVERIDCAPWCNNGAIDTLVSQLSRGLTVCTRLLLHFVFVLFFQVNAGEQRWTDMHIHQWHMMSKFGNSGQQRSDFMFYDFNSACQWQAPPFTVVSRCKLAGTVCHTLATFGRKQQSPWLLINALLNQMLFFSPLNSGVNMKANWPWQSDKVKLFLII